MDRYTGVLVIYLLWFLSLATTKFSVCHGNLNVLCREQERKALLTFKQGLEDSSNRLSSWTGKDCCMWEGVGCDNITGHVIELNLQNPNNPDTEFEDYAGSFLSGEISDSLLELKHLLHLDLSFNYFGGVIPIFFCSLTNLRYLDLHDAGFSGVIPPQLGNCTSLRHLDTGCSSYCGLYVQDLEWVSRLSSLEFLDMSRVNLSSTSNLLQVINMLSSLSVLLHLSSCHLLNFDPIQNANISSLVALDLSNNDLSSLTSNWFLSLSGLTSFDLRTNSFVGPIPVFLQNMTSLRHLDLSDNHFNATIPDWLYNLNSLKHLLVSVNDIQGIISSAIANLTSLTELDLSSNALDGEIPKKIRDLCSLHSLDLSANKLSMGIFGLSGHSSACIMNSLKILILGRNYLSGHLPNELGEFKSLTTLAIDYNNFSGPIPTSIGKLSSLEVLEISNNQLNGTIPESLGRLSKLEHLGLNHNLLEGVVSEAHFANLRKLKTLYASFNSLSLRVTSNWIPPFRLKDILMKSWDLGPKFPSWLQTQNQCQYLDLSSARILDAVPTWFWSLPKIEYLDLSNNQIYGTIPSLLFGSMFLSSNNFSGPLPHISSSVVELDLSNNSFSGSLSSFLCERMDEQMSLFFLDLSRNLLSGELPDCWVNWTSLAVLRLGNNNLTGIYRAPWVLCISLSL